MVIILRMLYFSSQHLSPFNILYNELFILFIVCFPFHIHYIIVFPGQGFHVIFSFFSMLRRRVPDTLQGLKKHLLNEQQRFCPQAGHILEQEYAGYSPVGTMSFRLDSLLFLQRYSYPIISWIFFLIYYFASGAFKFLF